MTLPAFSLGRWLAIAAVGVVICGAIAFGLSEVYSAGYEAADAKAQVRIDALRLEAEGARADKALQVAAANARAAKLEADAQRRVATAQRQARDLAEIAKRSTDEHPEFASLRRPADLDRVRDQQLADIADAAGRPADLPADGVRAMRSAEDHPGRNAGDN